ncbi:MAG: 1-acyl-sn-glycerol-3-phosphate acyltransferase [Holophagaceae bacterium]|nr:1-acyl-sn-glycerol-3-phosphate acyltransferase [Holophagaceae bacterium]
MLLPNPWVIFGLGLGLLMGVWLLRRWIRRRVYRAAVRTRRELGFHLNPVTVTRKQKLKRELVEDPKLQALVREECVRTGAEEAQAWMRVTDYLDEIIPNFNLLTAYRFGKKAASVLLRSFYRVRIGRSAEAELNRIPRTASVVYVMNHRSNADYLLVAFLLANRVAISYAVGEWARIWPLERLFKSFGSFFVRRKFRDPLYHAVLERYVQRAVEAGITQGIFLEGGLSRDGALQPPKLGLLDYMARANAKDLVFIPVGINYDRVVEDSALVRELSGLPKHGLHVNLRRSAFWLSGLMFRGALGRFYRFGYAIANFGPPLGIGELTDGADIWGMEWEERKPVLDGVAHRLLQAVGNQVPITPVAVVAWSWVQLNNRSVGRLALRQKTLETMAWAAERNLPLYMARGNFQRIFEMGLRVLTLRGILVAEGDVLASDPAKEPLLSYYANSIAHHFG